MYESTRAEASSLISPASSAFSKRRTAFSSSLQKLFFASSKRFCKSCCFFSSFSITQQAKNGIALSALPELKQAIFLISAFFKSEARSTAAFCLPLFISVPECPPAREVTVTFTVSPAAFSVQKANSVSARIPPAQLASSVPSSSESRLMSILLLSTETSSAFAPSIPVSSSTVRTTSSAGWEISSRARISSAYAPAIPSSPPREVPFAKMKSSSSQTVRGSVSKLI